MQHFHRASTTIACHLHRIVGYNTLKTTDMSENTNVFVVMSEWSMHFFQWICTPEITFDTWTNTVKPILKITCNQGQFGMSINCPNYKCQQVFYLLDNLYERPTFCSSLCWSLLIGLTVRDMSLSPIQILTGIDSS